MFDALYLVTLTDLDGTRTIASGPTLGGAKMFFDHCTTAPGDRVTLIDPSGVVLDMREHACEVTEVPHNQTLIHHKIRA